MDAEEKNTCCSSVGEKSASGETGDEGTGFIGARECFKSEGGLNIYAKERLLDTEIASNYVCRYPNLG